MANYILDFINNTESPKTDGATVSEDGTSLKVVYKINKHTIDELLIDNRSLGYVDSSNILDRDSSVRFVFRRNGASAFGINTVRNNMSEEIIVSDKIDTQTKNISQGINLILSYYPEAKLLVGYDQEIIMVLPYYERVVPKELEDKLVSLGWKHLEYIPWMWEYQTEGSVYDYFEEK